MDVAPHPHVGLQTVTWLLDGEVLHDDSLRHEDHLAGVMAGSILRPGGVNVMTSGGGIAHAERTPADDSGRLNGVQLWTALPDEHRHATAPFQHVAQVPSLEFPGGVIQVFSGCLEKVSSPAQHYSELLGADLQWNFVARTPEEIRDARMDWEEHRRFGEVKAYDGPV